MNASRVRSRIKEFSKIRKDAIGDTAALLEVALFVDEVFGIIRSDYEICEESLGTHQASEIKALFTDPDVTRGLDPAGPSEIFPFWSPIGQKQPLRELKNSGRGTRRLLKMAESKASPTCQSCSLRQEELSSPLHPNRHRFPTILPATYRYLLEI